MQPRESFQVFPRRMQRWFLLGLILMCVWGALFTAGVGMAAAPEVSFWVYALTLPAPFLCLWWGARL